jgi:hypothetical protein
MTRKPTDPLLAAARMVLIIAMGLTLAAAAAFTIGLVAVAVTGGEVWRGFAQLGPRLFWVVESVLVLLGATAVTAFLFLRHLYRIVGTVGEGDPFVPVNADRFRAMGWLTLAGDALLIGVAVLTQLAPHNRMDSSDFNFAFGGLLLALVLFVIARVFREGTRMREELEGTV